MASHIYLVTESMKDEYFYSADGELLVVLQEGRLRFAPELGVIDVEPQEIALIPRGLVYRVASSTAASCRHAAVWRSATGYWTSRAPKRPG